jgi:hypothetical protein
MESKPSETENSIKTSVELDDEGEEVVDARDFGTGTDKCDDLNTELEAIDVENLKELDQLGIFAEN